MTKTGWKALNGWEKFSLLLFVAGPIYALIGSIWINIR